MANLYVDLNAGNESNAGTSAGSPWLTLAKLAASESPGDHAYIKGSAAQAAGVVVTVSGTPAAQNVWEGYTTTPGDGGSCTLTDNTGINFFDLTNSGYRVFRNMTLTQTGATRGIGFGSFTVGNVTLPLAFENVRVDGCSVAVEGNNSATDYIAFLYLRDCVFENCSSHGVLMVGLSVTAQRTNFIANGGDGLRADSPSAAGITRHFEGCGFAGNAGSGINFTGTTSVLNPLVLKGNAFVSNGADGVTLATTDTTDVNVTLHDNNVYFGNSGKGINVGAPNVFTVVSNRTNAYGNNGGSSGAGANDKVNFPADDSDLALAAQPFNNPTSGDFTTNTTAGAGAVLRGAGTPTNRDVGPTQSAPSGGGGVTDPGVANVRAGVTYSGLTGTCHVPTASQTLSGVSVDATTGNVVLPDVSVVEAGQTFGPSSSLTGTLTGGSALTLSQLQGELQTFFGSTGFTPATVLDANVTQVAGQTAVAAGPVTFPGAIGTSTYAGGAVASVTGPVGSVVAPVTAGTVSDKSGYALAPAGLDAIAVETGVNARQALSPILAATAGVLSGANPGGGTVVIKGGNVTTTRITANTDGNGNRTSVTLALPA